MIKGKRILITGGTGSFGNAFIDFSKDCDIKFVVFSRDEKKQHDMFVERNDNNIEYVVGDIRDKSRILKHFKNVDYVMHAAALKHVPTGEQFPEEVINTNVLGTKNVIEAAEECGVEKIINLSTDKAVYPINAYGMSKALAEKLMNAHTGDTACVCLRYGNVIGSRGSVIPLFIDKVRNNLPLTITNENMTRFLLPLSHAVALSKKCLEIGQNGDLFVIRPPAATIKTVIDALELYYGKTLEKQIIGIRPGEKMDETLLTPEELCRAQTFTDDGIEYMKIPRVDGNIGDYFYHGEDCKIAEPFTSANTTQLSAEETLNLIKEAGLLCNGKNYKIIGSFTSTNDILLNKENLELI
ncbi:MAG: NAD-dependent epimerase/dehydratase family protein [Alphaproteobacteria bacterium]|nr:MAG: NAD-dependent epimerase/dehydratase family protein [Alphaproteobacteria bacterium]